ncbi:MAG: hypothetical protein N2258_07420 [Brevinematales bacterium]|nr:hypothetical protein [Brevinematales bacterium]
MKKHFFLLFLVSIVLFSCGIQSKKEVVYPKYHYVSIYKTSSLKNDERIEYLVWGTKLEVEEVVSITNISEDQSKTNIVNSFKVLNTVSKNRGYVAESDVVRNPLMKGVIINSTAASEVPNMGSFSKKSLKPFIPVYVLAISEDKELYNVSGYINKNFVLPEEEETITPIWKPLWVYKTDVSTNKNDVELIILQQLSVKRYREALAAYQKEPEKKAKDLTNIVQRESDEMRIALDKFKGASSSVISYVTSYRERLNAFISGAPVEEEYNEEEDNTYNE